MNKTIAIAGLGLIGGSLALALKAADAAIRVIGIDRDPAVLSAARQAGAVDEIGTRGLSRVGTLVLALPPEAAAAFLAQHAEELAPGTIVTDVCGVKRAVMERCVPLCRARGLWFVGGHPMAGREKGGFENAVAGLFRGASYILTPPDGTPPAVMDALSDFVRTLGCARVTVTTPEEHDRRIAFTSQLPHVLAGAYVKSPQCPGHEGYSAGSYRDVSRVAAVDETLWAELFLLNRDNLCAEIDRLIDSRKSCRDAAAAGDRDRLEAVIREGRLRKEGNAR